MKIALVTYNKQKKYTAGTQSDEDENLLKFLLSKKLDAQLLIWNDPAVDWSLYDKIVLKSPWDYHEQFPAFNAWLSKMEALRLPLVNPCHIIRWNIDKHYLKEIEASGLPIIAALFLEKNTLPVLSDFFTQLDAQLLVIKPCVSASARNTMVISPENVAVREQELHALLQEESYIVQPFMNEIRQGELSFVFFGKNYSHCVLKSPKPGDFRVQHFHGGTIMPYEPKAEYIAAAQEYVSNHARNCLYTRVDGLLINNKFQLMELELIEPYLYLDFSAGAYQRYYEALIQL